jgi:hypothetical protein
MEPLNIRRSNRRNRMLGFALVAVLVAEVPFLPFFLVDFLAGTSSGGALG